MNKTQNNYVTHIRTMQPATAAITAGYAVDIITGAHTASALTIQGIAAYDADIGEEIVLHPYGEVRKAIYGDTITKGNKLTSSAGKLIPVTTIGQVVVAIALEDGADTEERTVWVVNPYEYAV